MKKRKWIAAAAVLLFIAAAAFIFRSAGTTSVQEAGGLSAPAEEGGPAEENGMEKPSGTSEEETEEYAYPGENNREDEEYRETDVEEEPEGPAGALEEEDFVQKKIVVATDLHYLAEKLAGNRGPFFMAMAEQSDGRVLQYGWEILDAFLDDVLEEKPDLVLLSGDLTLNGERESHEELAEKLSVLPEHNIEVAVIPGNHDINNPYASAYTSDGVKPVESITAEDFASIYADYGYIAADSRDPNSLSYLYKLDDYYWLLCLDSCQYDPINQVGGMIRRETYRWMEGILEEAWEQGAQIISVTHHNLLDQSGVSKEFYDDCTIEHNEELVELLSDNEVRLHLSGHLHLQHYLEDGDSGIAEMVTGSLVMAPCHYGILQIWNNGTLQYDAAEVDVDGWAERNHYKMRDLADFKAYSEQFLWNVSYSNAMQDLKKYVQRGELALREMDMEEMASFYAKMCVHYFGGRMYEIADEVKQEPAYQKWIDVEYVSELSDFLRNILEDDAKDFSKLTLPY